jgi:microcystin-dependent protein
MISFIGRGTIKDPAVVREFEHMIARLRSFLSQVFDEDGNLIVADPNLAIFAVGDIKPTARPDAQVQNGWLLCNGAQVSRITYNSLYQVIGTAYGAGDGSTTFNLPDLRGRFPLGKSAAGTGSALGATGGALDHTHTGPSHTHTFSATSSSAGGHDHAGSTGSAGGHSHTYSGTTSSPSATAQVDIPVTSPINVAHQSHTHTFSGSTTSDGSHSHSINNAPDHSHTVSGTSSSSGTGNTGSANPPYVVVNYVIFAGV